MRLVIQRVSHAKVEVEGKTVGSIGTGLLVLLGCAPQDTEKMCAWLAPKLVHLRCFPDEAGKMNLSLLDSKGSALVVSQFTLLADCTEGRRPSFIKAAPPPLAEPLCKRFVEEVRKLGVTVETGVFGASMRVSLLNDGPVTFVIDSK